MPLAVVSPSTAPLPPPTGVSADIISIEQSALNFLPVLQQAQVSISTAMNAPATDPFHQALNVFVAADQSITPYVPNASVQAVGGLAAIVASLLSRFIPVKAPAAHLPVAPVAVATNAPPTAAPASAPASAPSIQTASLNRLKQAQAALQAQIAQVEAATPAPVVAAAPKAVPGPSLMERVFHPKEAAQEQAAHNAAVAT